MQAHLLSNTATPKYYKRFRDAVLRGEIPVNAEIAMEMNRIDELIARPDIYYDPCPVEGFIKFCEHELTLTDGGDLRLLDSFKLWGEQLFCWYYYVDRSVPVPSKNGGVHYEIRRVKKRLTKKQYLIVARGNAKSVYASCVQAYGLLIDRSTTDQVVVAPTIRQADETLSPIRTAIAISRGPLFKMLTEGSINNTTGDKRNRVKLASTKKGIENFITNSIIEIRPMAIDKLQGLRCKYATVDEWLSGEIREDPIGAIEQGAAKGDLEYLIVATSSEGTIRNGCGDTIKIELMKILKGEYRAPHVSIFYYRLDDIRDVGDPNKWVMASPNIGITVSYETYQADIERMEKNPAVKNDILAKRFGIPSEGYTYYFAYQDTLPHPFTSFYGMRCTMGIDLSQGNDFCAFTFLFPLSNGSFGVKCRSYITSTTLSQLPAATRNKYQEFLDEGSLMVFESTIIDLDDVYDDLDRFIQNAGYEVDAIGYDPYNAKSFIDRWTREYGPYGIEKVIQGSKTETVPLGELKTLAENRMLIFDESIMQYTMGNAITIEDTNGNRKLLKRRYEQKIDNVSALMDAFVTYKLHKELFY